MAVKKLINNKYLKFSLNFILFSLIFSAIYTTLPLYQGNQNTYLLPGLIKGGFGYLNNDWFATITDPFPVFSYLVSYTYKYLSEVCFYIYFIFLFGIYIFSLREIADEVFKFSKIQKKIFMLLFFIIHSVFFRSIFNKLFGHTNLINALQEGVAQQYILGTVFQPSLFGVLILLSIFLFLRKRNVASIIALATAATFHPTYLLSAAAVVISYILLNIKNKQVKNAVFIGVLSFILVLPIFIYTAVNFGPTSGEVLKQAQNILINYRMPHHALPANWLNFWAYFKLILIITAIYLVKEHKLSNILSSCLIISVLLTILQVVTNSSALALLFPWRLSVFLVPISTTILLGFSSVKLSKWYPPKNKLFDLLILFILLFLILKGLTNMRYKFFIQPANQTEKMMQWIKRRNNTNNTYLIPPDKWTTLERFRLNTGVPIFVDSKTHPYKDTEVISWYQRIVTAENFYKNDLINYRTLTNLKNNYKVSHLLLKKEGKKNILRKHLKKIYQDSHYVIYRIIR